VETHGPLIAQAAGLGVPLIISEKPLCLDASEARGAIEACRRGGSILMVNHERRYSRDYRQARALIRARRHGFLLSVQARVWMGRGQPLGRILLEDGTHMVDILRYLTGEELELRHVQGDPGSPAGTLQVLFGAGRSDGYLEVSGGHDALLFELELGFERGRLRLGNGIYEEWESRPSPYYEGFRSLRRLRRLRRRATGYFAGMLADAVRVFREPGHAPESSGLDGLRAIQFIEAIVGSS
jgi:predicted dehydrogenase